MWPIPLQHCLRQLHSPQAQAPQLIAEAPTSLTPSITPQGAPLSCMAVSSAHSLAAFAGQGGLLRLCPLSPTALRSGGAWISAPQTELLAQDVQCLAWCHTSTASGVAHLAAGCGSTLICTKW